MENNISLEGFCAVVDSVKPITVHLYDENDLLLITFELAGYNAIDDFLCDDEVTKIKFKTINVIEVWIDTSKNG